MRSWPLSHLFAQVLVASTCKPLQRRFFAYGAREDKGCRNNSEGQKGNSNHKAPQNSSSIAAHTLEILADVKVPHRWFTHFYLLSLCLSAFWLQQLQQHGQVLQWINITRNPSHASMTLEQVVICWLLMVTQAGRRLFECVTLGARSQTSMWVGHWLVGLGFYAAMSIAVWIEGPRKSPCIVQPLAGRRLTNR